MQLFSIQSIIRAERRDALAQPAFLAFEPLTCALACGEIGQELLDQRGHRCIALSRDHARAPIRLVIKGDRDVFHSFTVSRGWFDGNVRPR
jgi:hypothetical protein